MPSRLVLLLVCALGTVAADAPTPNAAKPSAEADDPVKTTLLIQSAMQQARECLTKGEFQVAVRVLEGHLPKINGNPVYLALLEEAYRGLIRDLKQRGQEELAQKYLDRLAILDPGVVLVASVRPAVSPAKSPAPDGKVTVRGSSADDKAQADNIVRIVQDALAAGDKEFQAHHFREAGVSYQKAYQLDRNLPPANRERWAYCKLFVVTEQLNNPPPEGQDWNSLEQEVRTALSLAPRMEYGHTLLKTVQERAKAAPAKTGATSQYHAQRPADWQVMDSANFRVHHNDPALADQVLQMAEHTRRAVALKWLGETNLPNWTPRCDIYLHANVQAYTHATGVGSESPGHSSIGAEKQDASRIHSRVIHLHVDDPNLLLGILPHETTHVTLAGHYGPQPLPRWADEGLAVLSEPTERLQRHLRALPEAYREGRVYTAAALMPLEEYPTPAMMSAFYGQSVALVSYLSDLRGPQAFTEFLRSAQRDGYEAALRRHYGFNGYADLDKRWREQNVGDKVVAAGTP